MVAGGEDVVVEGVPLSVVVELDELSVLVGELVSVEETLLSVDEEDPVSDELDEPGSVGCKTAVCG